MFYLNWLNKRCLESKKSWNYKEHLNCKKNLFCKLSNKLMETKIASAASERKCHFSYCLTTTESTLTVSPTVKMQRRLSFSSRYWQNVTFKKPVKRLCSKITRAYFSRGWSKEWRRKFFARWARKRFWRFSIKILWAPNIWLLLSYAQSCWIWCDYFKLWKS